MASHPVPNALAFKAAVSASILKGTAVKAGADDKHVALATAVSDKIIGIALGTPLLAEDIVEVALPGGGAKALLGSGGCAFGDWLTTDGSGNLIVSTTANDRVIAQALNAGSAGDLVAVQVVSFNY